MALFGRENLQTLGATLQDVGASLGGGQGTALQSLQARREAQLLKEQKLKDRQAIESSISDPRELMLFKVDPEAWAKARATQFEARNVSGGDTVLLPGGPNFTAPKLVNDDGIYGTQTAGGYTQTGARGPSIAETETSLNNVRDYNARLTPEGFLPTLDDKGIISGANLIPGYGQFAKEKAAAGATKVNVPITLPAQNAFSEELAKQYARGIEDDRKAAETAQGSIDILRTARGLVKNGVYTGALADERLKLSKLAAPFSAKTRERVANTEAFQAVMGQQVLNVVKQLGSANAISDADREYAQKVAAGSIVLDQKAIDKLIGIQERAARKTVNRYNERGRDAFNSVPPAQGLPRNVFRALPNQEVPDNSDPLGLR